MYSELFSKIYNEFGWNYYPEAFAKQLIAWISKNKPDVRNVLDLGCGTGVLCRILRENGIEADGVDISENMIAIAKEADPQGHYETADMKNYRPKRRYDLVTCTGDAFNHLKDTAELEMTFRLIAGYLEEGGCLIFDLADEREVADPEPIEFDYNENTKASFLMTKGENGAVTLRVSVKENGVSVLEEVIREQLYDVREVIGLLEGTGFCEVTCSHRLLEDGGPPVQTWYVIAQIEERNST